MREKYSRKIDSEKGRNLNYRDWEKMSDAKNPQREVAEKAMWPPTGKQETTGKKIPPKSYEIIQYAVLLIEGDFFEVPATCPYL